MGPALTTAGLPTGTHVHDLRHTGNTFSAEAGASRAELMSRMGHSSARAAKVYLHARDGRDQQLAVTLDRMARRELKRSAGKPNASQSGTLHFLRLVMVGLLVGFLRGPCDRQRGSARLGASCRRTPAWPCTQLTA